jgi:hypothetical protein
VPAVKCARLVHRFVALAFVAVGLGACGGSASETPWPSEPDNVDLGPLGESQREEEPVQKPKDQPKDDQGKPDPNKQAPKVDPVAP